MPQNFIVLMSVQLKRLPNGNTLIDEGSDGRVFEVTAEKEVVLGNGYLHTLLMVERQQTI